MVASVVLLAACAPTTAGVGQDPNPELAAYRIVLLPEIIAENGQRDPYSLEPILREQLQAAGLRVLPWASANQLSPVEITQTLTGYVSYFWTPNFGGSFATLVLEFHDALGRQVFRGQGTHQDFSFAADARGAARNAVSEFTRTYPGFDAIAESPVAQTLRTWPRIQRSEESARASLEQANGGLDAVEGIWVASDNTYRLALLASENERFDATILESGSPLWTEGMIKMRLDRTAIPGAYSVTYFMGDLSSVGRTATLRDGILTIPQLPDRSGNFSDAVFVKTFPPLTTTESPRTTEGDGANAASRSTTGSGFLVSEGGLVATNAHVVADRQTIAVTLGEPRRTYAASVLILDRDNDLAILLLEGFAFDAVFSTEIPYGIADSAEPSVGDSVLAAGYPVSSILGGELRVTDGIISSRSGIQGAPNVFQITNPLQPGNSGGPLFNESGDVVGIAVASVNAGAFLGLTGSLPQNINFAVKSSYLRSLIAMLPGTDLLEVRSSLAGPIAARDVVSRSAPFIASIEAR